MANVLLVLIVVLLSVAVFLSVWMSTMLTKVLPAYRRRISELESRVDGLENDQPSNRKLYGVEFVDLGPPK